MKHLYEIEDGATYWVVANDKEDALRTITECEAQNGCTYVPWGGVAVRVLNRKQADEIRYHLDGEEESCSMWFAYMLVRDFGSAVLACSEWP